MRERGSGLLAYARLLTGNDAEAEDVLQDALVRSFSRGRSFTHVNAAEAYVRRAIPSVFIDRLRHRRTRDGADERLAREQDEAVWHGRPRRGPRRPRRARGPPPARARLRGAEVLRRPHGAADRGPTRPRRRLGQALLGRRFGAACRRCLGDGIEPDDRVDRW